MYSPVLSVLKMSTGEATLLFLLALLTALIITADLIIVMVVKPFGQLFVCVKSKLRTVSIAPYHWAGVGDVILRIGK